MRRCVCASHGHCFDGLTSAALLTELVETLHPDSEFSYASLGYGAHPPRPEFDGDDNALLDYRYIADERLTFYFDHHPTAFADEAAQAHFEERSRQTPERFVFDANSTSCAQLIARVANDAYGLPWLNHQQLIEWARIVDGAQFETVEEATDLENPIMRLVSVVAHFGDRSFYTRAIPILRREGLAALSQENWIKDFYRKLAPSFRTFNQRMKKGAVMHGRVAYVRMLDAPVHVITKFRQYRDFPDATYSVVAAQVADGFRISVGHNPWSRQKCDVHIGEICKSYGGGGHSMVGGIGLNHLSAADVEKLALDIVKQLQTADGN